MQVILDKHEIYVGAEVGMRRNIISMGSRESNKVNNKDFGWHTDIESALAEMAVAKGLGIYWDGSVNTFKKPDVGNYQVRHTQVADGKLIIRPKDSTEEIYILVTGTSPTFILQGWIMGFDAKKDDHLFKGYNGMPDCWMVKQEYLNRIKDLK